MKKVLKIIIFFAIGIGFIWWFMSKLTPEEINQLLSSFSNANYYWIGAAILINILSSLIRALRWQQLIRPMGYNSKLTPTFLAVMSGYLANLAVPRLGEIVRCGLMRKNQKIPFEKAIGTVIIERAVDMILFILIFFIALLLEFNYIKDYIYNNFSHIFNFSQFKYYALFAFIGIILIAGILYIFRNRIKQTKLYIRIKDLILGLLEGIKSILKLKNPLLFIFNSLLIWFLWILGTYIIFLCLPQTLHLSFKIAVITTVLGALGPMVTPGGIGIFPAIIAETLFIYGIVKPIGYAAGWILWIVSQLSSVVVGLFGFVYFSHKK
jgi:uncharacterized protein (TIRG00374 family)